MSIEQSLVSQTRVICAQHGGEIVILNPLTEIFARLLSPITHQAAIDSLVCDAKKQDCSSPCRPVRIKLDD